MSGSRCRPPLTGANRALTEGFKAAALDGEIELEVWRGFLWVLWCSCIFDADVLRALPPTILNPPLY